MMLRACFVMRLDKKNQDNPECVPSLHAQVDSVNVTAKKVAARCVRSCIIYD